VLIALRTRALRDEFAKDLRQNAVVPEDMLLTVGAPPKNAPNAGSDPAAERVEMLVRLKLHTLVSDLEHATARLEGAMKDLWVGILRQRLANLDLDNPNGPQARAVAATHAAGRNAMRQLWELFRQWKPAQEAVLLEFRVVVCTVDLALKAFAKESQWPLSQLLSVGKVRALIIDEAQRVPASVGLALAANTPQLVLVGDPGQVTPTLSRRQERRNADEACALHHLGEDEWADGKAPLREDRNGLDELASARSNAASTLVARWPLTTCWRCGNPLVSFVATLLPRVAADLQPNPGRATNIHHVFYKASAESWWNRQAVLERMGAPKRIVEELPCQVKSQVQWQGQLFAALLGAVLDQLAQERFDRMAGGRPDPVFGEGEKLVFIGLALHRLADVLAVLFAAALQWEPLLQAWSLDQSGLRPEHVSVRVGNDSAGPTFLALAM